MYVERELYTPEPMVHTLRSATTIERFRDLPEKYTFTPASASGVAAAREFHFWYQCLPLIGSRRITSVPARAAWRIVPYISSSGIMNGRPMRSVSLAPVIIRA